MSRAAAPGAVAIGPAPVASPAQARAILDQVARVRLELTAFFGCLYNAALSGARRKGVCLAPRSGREGASGVADHAGTMAALAGFTRGAARDLAPKGITVNLLQTGLVATQLNTAAGSAAPQLIASVPVGRMGRPEEIAAGVLFLASPDASYITGATLDIDGGYGA